MENQDTKALAALQTAKQQGLNYFDATQSLKAQGFSDEAIENASIQFDYQRGVIRSASPQPDGAESQERATEKAKLDDELAGLDREKQGEAMMRRLNKWR